MTILSVLLTPCASTTRAAADGPAVYLPDRPLVRPAVPRSESSTAAHPIDAFLDADARADGLEAVPEADRPTLIRRLSYDLRGLPPSPEEIDAFENDPRPDAWERLVDRFSADPAVGEKRAEWWLDLVRYADSSGFEDDSRRPTAYRYRDWVVSAFNRGLPFDRFLQMQLAADELSFDEPDSLAALGFLRAGPSVGNERTPRTRADELDDVVSTTSAVFLGLTLGCARCHDHPTDPLSMVDYYRMIAVFEPAQPAELSLARPGELAEIERRTSEIDSQVDRLLADRIAAVGDPPANDPISTAAALEFEIRGSLWAARKPEPPATAPGVRESGAAAPETRIAPGGDPEKPGDVVPAGPPRSLEGGAVDFPTPGRRARSSLRRSALALWMTRPDHPLTARVIVNRLWQQRFGEGLVRTPSDFGHSGDPPDSPELLDWLAAELVARRWDLRAVDRLMLISAAYRRSSRRTADLERRDPANRRLRRHSIRRLTAEEIRDSILAGSGSLDRRIGGPGFFGPIDPAAVRTGNLPRRPTDVVDGPSTWRRSVYLFRLRSVPDPFLGVFDQPDAARTCAGRLNTVTPSQALTLMNDPFVEAHAERLAARVLRELGSHASAERYLDRLSRIVTGRRASPELVRRAAASIDQAPPSDLDRVLTDLALILYNGNAFLYVD
ncbi:MAG: DUF1549 and DUF1553 domain-containing protein [Isosphaeraceae bacterium]|nr:DUF1549 and DUF1553 domain-containing protein [Isosphaeraceae bacterium]